MPADGLETGGGVAAVCGVEGAGLEADTSAGGQTGSRTEGDGAEGTEGVEGADGEEGTEGVEGAEGAEGAVGVEVTEEAVEVTGGLWDGGVTGADITTMAGTLPESETETDSKRQRVKIIKHRSLTFRIFSLNINTYI